MQAHWRKNLLSIPCSISPQTSLPAPAPTSMTHNTPFAPSCLRLHRAPALPLPSFTASSRTTKVTHTHYKPVKSAVTVYLESRLWRVCRCVCVCTDSLRHTVLDSDSGAKTERSKSCDEGLDNYRDEGRGYVHHFFISHPFNQRWRYRKYRNTNTQSAHKLLTSVKSKYYY